MAGTDLARAIASLRPGKAFVLSGDTLTGLTWLDAGSPPTEAEINAEATRLADLDAAMATDPDRLDILSRLRGASPAAI
jgi:hypothetical protein